MGWEKVNRDFTTERGVRMMVMDGYMDESAGCLYLTVANLSELNALLQQAKEESDRLAKTIDQIRRFKIQIKFSKEPISE